MSLAEKRKAKNIDKNIKGDPVDSWAKRLSKLTGISLEEALIIAEEKLDYKEQCIRELEYRDAHAPSVKREQLINKIKRSNPLRYIKDSEHASNILTASSRHNGTDYEQQLDYARGLAASGEIGKEEVKEYARTHSVTFAN